MERQPFPGPGGQLCLLRAREQMDLPDPEGAVRSAFTSVFSTFVVRVAYGPAIAVAEVDDDAFIEWLSTMESRYLLRPQICRTES